MAAGTTSIDTSATDSVARALFLDVDGTLLEIAESPDEVRVAASLITLLQRLYELHDGALALVSGRPVAQLDMLFAPLQLPAAGLHGMERRDRMGSPPPDLERLRKSRNYLTDFVGKHAGLLLEDKGRALALHYRLAPHLESQARLAAAAVLEALGPKWELLEGKKVLELKPAGYSKGAAIAQFMQQPPFAGRIPVFVGDDCTDEHGFAYVNACSGESIHVGSRTDTAAKHRLADVPAVHRWLQSLVEAGADVE